MCQHVRIKIAQVESSKFKVQINTKQLVAKGQPQKKENKVGLCPKR